MQQILLLHLFACRDSLMCLDTLTPECHKSCASAEILAGSSCENSDDESDKEEGADEGLEAMQHVQAHAAMGDVAEEDEPPPPADLILPAVPGQ